MSSTPTIGTGNKESQPWQQPCPDCEGGNPECKTCGGEPLESDSPSIGQDRLAEVVHNAQGKRRGRKPKQEVFEDMKQAEIPEVSVAAQDYADLRDERMELTRKEVEARQLLIDLMHKNNLTTYKVGQLTASLETSEKVKVQVEKEEDLEVY